MAVVAAKLESDSKAAIFVLASLIEHAIQQKNLIRSVVAMCSSLIDK